MDELKKLSMKAKAKKYFKFNSVICEVLTIKANQYIVNTFLIQNGTNNPIEHVMSSSWKSYIDAVNEVSCIKKYALN